ncbi:MAG: DNA mismatch repair protein MutS, partial [Spirochaetales bacterium]|nr:DNA mismatch repair protein MutS [Spirochaetales bacterium]
THYHELTKIEDNNLINLHLDVIEKEGDVIFLKKVVEGAAGNSYGLHVAKLAGIPQSVLLRAASILAGINTVKGSGLEVEDIQTENVQPSLFSRKDIIESSIKSVDLNSMSPIEALKFLFDLRAEIEAAE